MLEPEFHSWKTLTRAVLVLVVVLLVLYDVILIWATYSDAASISMVVCEVAKEWPIICVGAGLCCGHLFGCDARLLAWFLIGVAIGVLSWS